MLLPIACLAVVLGVHTGLRLMGRLLHALDLDPWDVLLYVGLAEHELPPAPRRIRLPA